MFCILTQKSLISSARTLNNMKRWNDRHHLFYRDTNMSWKFAEFAVCLTLD